MDEFAPAARLLGLMEYNDFRCDPNFLRATRSVCRKLGRVPPLEQLLGQPTFHIRGKQRELKLWTVMAVEDFLNRVLSGGQ